MLRRCLGTAAVLSVLGGFVVAETYRGTLVKVEDGKLTVRVRGEDKKGTEKTFKLSKDAKFVVKARDKGGEDKEVKLAEVKEMIEKAAKAEKGGKGKGGRDRAGATIETTREGDAETVTKVTIGGGRGKRKKDAE
jgi:hypothetical protein